MKKIEKISMEELEMVIGGNCIDTGNMEEAAKVRSVDPSEKDTFVWIKKTP